jgi:predicted ArsR family transcriptional regulator
MTETYPHLPGFQDTDTSKAAAGSVAPSAHTLRDAALRVLKSGPRTADEVAAALGESILSIRPRLTELRMMARVYDTGERRKNSSGRSAIVWRAA